MFPQPRQHCHRALSTQQWARRSWALGLEQHNVISDPAYADIAGKLRKQVAMWMKRSDDPLLEGDVPPTEAQRRRQSQDHYNNG